MKHFTPSHKTSAKSKEIPPKSSSSGVEADRFGGVNLGKFYASRAVENSPKFVQEAYADLASQTTNGPRHVALVKIRNVHEIDDSTLDGVARTLSQLAKLGMTSSVVVDIGEPYNDTDSDNVKLAWRELAIAEADRLVTAIDAHSLTGARREDCILGVSDQGAIPVDSSATLGGKTYVRHRKVLMTPLKKGMIPVVPCIGYTNDSQLAVPLDSDEVMLALTREFAGLGFRMSSPPEEDPKETASRLAALREEVLLDRLIILDPLGGIPNWRRNNGYHVFLNMEQEYPIVKNELLNCHGFEAVKKRLKEPSKVPKTSDLDKSNPMSQFVQQEFGTPIPTPEALAADDLSQPDPEENLVHLGNLELVRKVLSILPPTSSALLTTPAEAAASGNRSNSSGLTTGVGTRTQRNPLIHNLLTDKPVFSSSLPAGRLGPGHGSSTSPGTSFSEIEDNICRTTFAKRGMSVTIFPDPTSTPWQPPVNGKPQIDLTDPRIDLPRLVHLINDSFDRKLDVPAYLQRVNKQIAGVIIAGEYEGGALLTWELPPGIDPLSPEADGRWVPYLDKFAVLKRSQGSGGVADVVFKAMVRDCFPEGLCWRSRKTNPVNKWYFERSRGTWRIPATEWTMFWTTEGIERQGGLFSDYEGVCESIVPTWADNKAVVD